MQLHLAAKVELIPALLLLSSSAIGMDFLLHLVAIAFKKMGVYQITFHLSQEPIQNYLALCHTAASQTVAETWAVPKPEVS